MVARDYWHHLRSESDRLSIYPLLQQYLATIDRFGDPLGSECSPDRSEK